MILNVHPGSPVTVATLDVPSNGGTCIYLTSGDGLTFYLPGYGEDAAVAARALAKALMVATLDVKTTPMAPVCDEVEF